MKKFKVWTVENVLTEKMDKQMKLFFREITENDIIREFDQEIQPGKEKNNTDYTLLLLKRNINVNWKTENITMKKAKNGKDSGFLAVKNKKTGEIVGRGIGDTETTSEKTLEYLNKKQLTRQTLEIFYTNTFEKIELVNTREQAIQEAKEKKELKSKEKKENNKTFTLLKRKNNEIVKDKKYCLHILLKNTLENGVTMFTSEQDLQQKKISKKNPSLYMEYKGFFNQEKVGVWTNAFQLVFDIYEDENTIGFSYVRRFKEIVDDYIKNEGN